MTDTPPATRPTGPAIQPSGHYSVVHLPGHWYVLCLSRELKRKPIARTLHAWSVRAIGFLFNSRDRHKTYQWPGRCTTE